MESNNMFNLGMDSDSSKLFQNEGSYQRAFNFRNITELGQSNNALVNIKGNECAIGFPELKGVYKLRIKEVLNGDGVFLTGTVIITINSQSTSPINILATTTPLDLYTAIISLSNCIKNVSAVNPTFDIAYNDEYIVIYQTTIYEGCDPDSPVEPVISISLESGSSTVEFINNINVGTPFYTPYVPAITDKLIIIGSTFIGEDIFLFTCPIVNTNLVGQIWKLTYDELTKISTIVLLYNGYLNFLKEFPIAPSAAIGRYEIDTIQRIYWTDFNNPVRTVNTQDPNLMALTVDLINLRPSTDMNIPVLTNILDGQAVSPLPVTGTYQCAYRLLKNNGAMTNYSTMSNIVYLTKQPISGFNGFQSDYASLAGDGPGNLVNKAIQWTVDGIDTSYDSIEFIVIQRFYPNENTFNIYKFDTQIINGNEKLSAIYRNEDTVVPITEEEFLLENTTFTHCKTIEQKDNRLFFGNVKNSLSDYLDTFDTRAFRFNSNTNNIPVLTFESDLGNSTYIINTSADWLTIPENADLIPVYNLGLCTTDNFIYNPDTKYQRNSSIIGGTGPNISYKFGSILLRSDSDINSPSATALGATEDGTTRDINTSILNYKNGYRRAGYNVNATGLNPFSNEAPFQIYNQNNIKMSMGIEYLNGTFKSYQHNEIYRFGILFYSKTGDSNFVKWIGDIKFPNYSHPVAPGLEGITNTGATCSDHRSMFYDTDGAYCNIPYIEFTVDVPAGLEALIDGYEIVRVKRDLEDMSIPTTGLINAVQNGYDTEASNFFLPVSHNSTISAGGSANMSPDSSGFGYTEGPKKVLTFHPYDYICDQSASNVQENDRIVITEKYRLTLNNPVNPDPITPISGGVGYEQYYYISKYYGLADFIYTEGAYLNGATPLAPANPYGPLDNILKIKEGYYVAQDGESPTLNVTGTVYKNRDWARTVGIPTPPFQNKAYAQGSPTIVIGIDDTFQPIIWSNYNANGDDVANGDISDSKLLALHFKPTKLSTQYGGRSYVRRANNEYISTGAYYSVRNSATTKIKAFGGDVYHGIIDIQKAVKNWAGTVASQPLKHSQTWYYPTQSRYNVDLRQGVHVNADLDNDAGTGGSASAEDNYINYQQYNYENTLKKHYPKPIFFNETSTWNNRVYWSEVKINGENSDSWSVIPVNDFYDVEGNYGGINALVILRNNMYFLQDRALGLLQINPQSLVTDQNNQTIKLGNGDTLSKHLYMSIDAGTKYQWSVYRSNSHITFVDGRHKKIFLFDGQQLNPISDTKGNRGFTQKVLHDDILIQDNPIVGNGILTTYDFKNNEFLYTFLNDFSNGRANLQEKYTLAYSDLTQKFNSFYSFTPYIYVNNHNKLYSPRDYDTNINSKLYLHNIGDYCKFYDTVYPSSLKVVVNTNPKYTKVFDNLSWITESIEDRTYYQDMINDNAGDSDDINFLYDTWTRARCYTEYQNTDWFTLAVTNPVTNLRKSEQGFNIQVPRNKVNWNTTPIDTKSIFDSSLLTLISFGGRLRDKYMTVDLEYNNALNNRFIVHNLSSNFRISDR